MKLKRLSLSAYSELTRNDETAPVFVLNRSEAEQLFTVTQGSRNFPIVVRQTWIPIDLTEQCVRGALLTAPHFRQLLTSKKLIIVAAVITSDEDKAKGMVGAYEALQTEAARSEVAAIQKEGNRTAVEDDDGDDSIDISGSAGKAKAKPKLPSETAVDINRFAQSLVARDEMGEEEEDSLLNALRSKVSTLNEADFRYIAESAKSTKLKEFASEQLI